MDESVQIQRDAAALQAISATIVELRQRWQQMQVRIDASERGYFLPPEDDEVRRVLLTYRNCRIALLEIIGRNQDWQSASSPPSRQQRFLVAFTAALLLYNWSTALVEAYVDVPVVRAKLNEPDVRFGIEPNLFETIHASLRAAENITRLQMAADYFERESQALLETADRLPPLGELMVLTQAYLSSVRHSWWEVLSDDLESRVEAFSDRAVQPFKDVVYHLRSWLCEGFGNLWLAAKPAMSPAHFSAFAELLAPGDIIIVRPERKTSTVLLPGWWTHGALYFGGRCGLEQLGLSAAPEIQKHWQKLQNAELVTMEALAEGVVCNPLRRTLQVDHAAILRPRLEVGQLRAAVATAFGHCGKAYDFEFDFSRSDRLVCTELIYRSFHGRGPIRLEPVLRLGRPTITADDVIRLGVFPASSEPGFEPIALSLRRPQGDELLHAPAARAALARTLPAA